MNGVVKRLPFSTKAGESFSKLVVPDGKQWRIDLARATLVADANVADRYLSMRIYDEAERMVYNGGLCTAITAGLTGSKQWTRGMNSIGISIGIADYGHEWTPLMLIPEKYSVQFFILGVQAGDTMTGILHVTELDA